jgi:hypothetical protein
MGREVAKTTSWIAGNFGQAAESDRQVPLLKTMSDLIAQLGI